MLRMGDEISDAASGERSGGIGAVVRGRKAGARSGLQCS